MVHEVKMRAAKPFGSKSGADVVADTPSLGACLRAVRTTKGMTLKTVSVRTGLALSTLSKVENGQMSLTYDKLRQLSDGLGISVAELFEPLAPPARTVVTARRSVYRAGQGRRVATTQYEHLYQFTDITRKAMVPIMARIEKRTLAAFGPLMRHPGEEYFLVLKGRVAVHTDQYAPDVLEEGDGIYLDSTMGHAYLNAADADASFGVCVCSGEMHEIETSFAPFISPMNKA